MNRLEKLKITLAREVSNQLACPALRSMYPSTSRGEMCDLFEDLYKTGWEKSSAEYEKIIAELEGALTNWMKFEEKSIAEDGHYVGKEFNALIKNAQDALQKLKDFKE